MMSLCRDGLFALTCLLCYLSLCNVTHAADVTTSFETTELSSFTLGQSPNSVTFNGGQAKFAGIASLYHSGSQGWLVNETTASVLFETPAAEIDFWLKSQQPAAGSEVRLYETGNILHSVWPATTVWQAISVTSELGIERIELENSSSGYAIIDDFSFTAKSAPSDPPPVSSDPQPLDDPLPLPIFKGAFKLSLTEVISDLTAPLWGLPAPGIASYMYVIEQTGKLWSINLSTERKIQIADLSGRLVDVGIEELGGFDERGLLGLVFHPDFASNGLLYTYTSELATAPADFSHLGLGEVADHQTVITQWHTTTGGIAGLGIDIPSAKVLMRIDQPQFNHNGGTLVFGPDKLLYISLGDGGGADDHDASGHGDRGNGQNNTNVLGTILRIDPLGTNSANGQYGIPADNPFIDSSATNEIFAFGLRNPYRMTFDTGTQAFYVTDVGQNDIEEINLVTAGDNLGWNLREGSFGFFANGNEDGYVFNQPENDSLVDPLAQYDHDEGIAIIGGFVYRNTTSQSKNITDDFKGRYVFGDYNGTLFYLNSENTISAFQRLDQLSIGALLGFARDPHGDLYVLANQTGLPSDGTGKIYRMNIFTNRAPIAVAGEDQSINENSTVILDARASSDPDNDSLRFEWQQLSGPNVTLDNLLSATPSFLAPDVDANTSLSFGLTVNDGHLGSGDEIMIEVLNFVGSGPNVAPVADAGVEQTAAEGTTVTLDGRGSSDPDDDPLTFRWQQLSGPNVILNDPISPTPRFTAPPVIADETLVFNLSVNDGTLGSSDEVTIQITDLLNPPPNQPPLAQAGDDQNIDEGMTVILDAGDSTDPDNVALNFQWQQLSGPNVDLTNPLSVVASFIAPTVNADTAMSFSVTVSDGQLSSSDGIIINIINQPESPPNLAPEARAGDDQVVDEGTTVVLNATLSSDPDNDDIMFEWQQLDGPIVELSTPTSALSSFTAPAVSENTTLSFSLTVNDGVLSNNDQLSIQIIDLDAPPPPEEPPVEIISRSSSGSLQWPLLVALLCLILLRQAYPCPKRCW